MIEQNIHWQEIRNNSLQNAGDVLVAAVCIDMPFTSNKQYSQPKKRSCNKRLR